MLIILRSSWALFFGVAMVFLANGLQGSLIGVRASIEGYSPFIVGIIMTGYYAGFMLGALFIPERIQKVGHVRVFASLASIASISILLHSLHFSVITWFIMRYTTGFCFVGMYCVAESWINDQSENESRGQALSVYMIISMGGNAIGQLFLNFADPSSATLFMLVSILISLSLVPILITVGKQPDFTAAKILSIKELYKASPLGVISAIGVGTAHGALWGVGSVYTIKNGLSISQTSFFMFSFIIGGAFFQYVIGYLSDKYDRRLILTIVTFAASGFSVLALIFNGSFTLLIIIAFTTKGVSLYLAKITMINVGEEVKMKLQSDMLKSLVNADTQLIDKKHSGKFISNLTYDVTHITNLLSSAILTVFKDSLTLIGLLLVMFIQNWKLALISIVMIPLASVSAKTLGKRISKVTTEAQEKSGDLNKYLIDIFKAASFHKD